MISNVALLSLPLLVAGAQHGHNHHHAHVARSQVDQCPTTPVTFTDTVIVTVTVAPSPAVPSAAPPPVISSAAPSSKPVVQVTTSAQPPPAQPSPPAPAPAPAQPAPAPAPAPSSAAPAPAKSPAPAPAQKPPANTGTCKFHSLQTVPNTAIVKNSCPYPVYLWSDGNASCDGKQTQAQLIEPQGTYSEPLRHCSSGGVALKISKTQDPARPMQFEYAIWSDGTTVSYDISFLDCLNNDKGQQDLSGCAGHEGGIQAKGGAPDSPVYQCPANVWCDTQAYVVQEYGYKPGAPVGAVQADKGVAFELCACS